MREPVPCSTLYRSVPARLTCPSVAYRAGPALVTCPFTPKGPLPLEEGPDLQKSVAGADLNPRPLGYEHHHVCLGQSPAGVVTSVDTTDDISLHRLRIPRLVLSRGAWFTNRFSEQAIDLLFSAYPSHPAVAVTPECAEPVNHYQRSRYLAHGTLAARLLTGWHRRSPAGDPLPEGLQCRDPGDRHGGQNRHVEQQLKSGAPGFMPAAEGHRHPDVRGCRDGRH
jgi:hypothetical protein